MKNNKQFATPRKFSRYTVSTKYLKQNRITSFKVFANLWDKQKLLSNLPWFIGLITMATLIVFS